MTLPVASTSGLHWFHDFCWAPIPELCMTKPWIAGTFVMENKQHYSLFHQNHPDRTCFVLFPWKLHLHWPRWQHSPKLWARKGWNQPQHLHFPWLSTDQMRSFSHWISEGKPGNHPFWTYQYINEKNNKRQNYSTFPMTTSDLLTSAKVGQWRCFRWSQLQMIESSNWIL